jgi:hypothetical protein
MRPWNSSQLSNPRCTFQEITMNTRHTSEAASETLNVAIAGGGTMELVAVITAMVFVACGAASLLLSTPSALQAVAHAAPTEIAKVAPAADRTFHERYPVSATAESIDVPTF